jgi:hypothetical protein
MMGSSIKHVGTLSRWVALKHNKLKVLEKLIVVASSASLLCLAFAEPLTYTHSINSAVPTSRHDQHAVHYYEISDEVRWVAVALFGMSDNRVKRR